jgi:hypothetical protein
MDVRGKKQAAQEDEPFQEMTSFFEADKTAEVSSRCTGNGSSISKFILDAAAGQAKSPTGLKRGLVY